MWKKIPGNSHYLVNLDNVVINSYGEIVDLEQCPNGLVSVDMYGKVVYIRKEQLSLLAWYELEDIRNLHEHLDKIRYHLCENRVLKVRCKALLSFSDPIYYREGFRYIPTFSRYAIDVDGVVLDTYTNTIIPKNKDTDEYETVNIYNPDKNGNRWTRIHRLLGLAWLPNANVKERPFINHIDGNKQNNRLTNLEWCSQQENNLHARDIGLLDFNVMMKTRDHITGRVDVYKSANDMSVTLGMTSVSVSNWLNKLPGYLWRNRYEVKRLDDDSRWYYEDAENIGVVPSKAIFTIAVTDPEGAVKKFNNVRAFYNTYKIWTKTGTLDAGVAAFKEKYPDFECSYKRNSVAGPYRVIDIHTKQTVLFSSMAVAGEYINRTKTEIQFDLSRRLKFIYSNRWIVILGSDDYNIDEYREKPKPFNGLVIIKELDESKITANSIKHASRITGIGPRTVAKCAVTGKSFKGFRFRPLE